MCLLCTNSLSCTLTIVHISVCYPLINKFYYLKKKGSGKPTSTDMTVFLSRGSLLEDLINPMIYIHTHTQFQSNAQQCGMLFTHDAVVYLTFWKRLFGNLQFLESSLNLGFAKTQSTFFILIVLLVNQLPVFSILVFLPSCLKQEWPISVSCLQQTLNSINKGNSQISLIVWISLNSLSELSNQT